MYVSIGGPKGYLHTYPLFLIDSVDTRYMVHAASPEYMQTIPD